MTAEERVARLLAGELAILPTDTVYGIACAAGLPEAVARALRAQAPARITADGDHAGVGRALDALLPQTDGSITVLLDRVLPGPITLVIPNPARRFRPCVRRGRTPASGCGFPT